VELYVLSEMEGVADTVGADIPARGKDRLNFAGVGYVGQRFIELVGKIHVYVGGAAGSVRIYGRPDAFAVDDDVISLAGALSAAVVASASGENAEKHNEDEKD